MAEQKIIINSTDTSGKAMQKTLTDINPDASNEQLSTFGQMLNNFTTNNYGKTERVIKVDCDAEAGGGKLTPTLQLLPASATLSQIQSANGFSVVIVNSGDGAFEFELPVGNNGVSVSAPWRNGNNHDWKIYGTASATTGEIIVRTRETDNYKAGEITFTITE